MLQKRGEPTESCGFFSIRLPFSRQKAPRRDGTDRLCRLSPRGKNQFIRSHERRRTGFPMLESMATATHEMSSTSARSGARMEPVEAIILAVEVAMTAAKIGVHLQAP
jgi:hypothetical protein